MKRIAVRKVVVIAGAPCAPQTLELAPYIIAAHTTSGLDHLRHSSLGHGHLQHSETSFPPCLNTGAIYSLSAETPRQPNLLFFALKSF